MQLNHGVTSARLWSANKNGGDRRLSNGLLVLALFIFFLNRLRLWHFLFLLFFFTIPAGWLDHGDDLFDLGLGLQVGQLLRITIKVEQLRDSIGLAQ